MTLLPPKRCHFLHSWFTDADADASADIGEKILTFGSCSCAGRGLACTVLPVFGIWGPEVRDLLNWSDSLLQKCCPAEPGPQVHPRYYIGVAYNRTAPAPGYKDWTVSEIKTATMCTVNKVTSDWLHTCLIQ